MKKKAIIITVAVILVLSLTASVAWFMQPKSEHYDNVSSARYRAFHGYFATETINSPISDEEREKIQPVLDRIVASFAYSGTEADFPYESELLKYTYGGGFSSVSHSFEPVAYQELFGKGYLWILYGSEYYAEDGSAVNGASGIYSLLVLDKTADGYVVKEIREHP